jgi:hypothetical protein
MFNFTHKIKKNMRKPLIFLFAIVALMNYSFAGNSPAPEGKKAKIVVKFSFDNIEDGYDHDNKTEVYIDGKLAGTSSVKKESKKNSVKVTTTQGTHVIKVVNYAYYEGNWEVHSIENNYSQDFVYIVTKDLTKSCTKIKLLFDIDNGMQLK